MHLSVTDEDNGIISNFINPEDACSETTERGGRAGGSGAASSPDGLKALRIPFENFCIIFFPKRGKRPTNGRKRADGDDGRLQKAVQQLFVRESCIFPARKWCCLLPYSFPTGGMRRVWRRFAQTPVQILFQLFRKSFPRRLQCRQPWKERRKRNYELSGKFTRASRLYPNP